MIKPIETVYNGYKFRSRLEARWAVFFDALGIPYKYEMEGYDLNGIWYLPDFWLPTIQRWIEIKGQEPTEDELKKLEALEAGSGYPASLFYGSPGENSGCAFYTCSHDSGNAGKTFNAGVVWRECTWCGMIDIGLRCHDGCRLYSEVDEVNLKPSCNCSIDDFKNYQRERFQSYGSDYSVYSLAQRRMLGLNETPTEKELEQEQEQFIEKLANDLYPRGTFCYGSKLSFRLQNAYTAARQARFEHGERGRQ